MLAIRCVGFVLLAFCAAGATGQVVVGPQVQVDAGNSGSGVEPSLAVSGANPLDVWAAGFEWDSGLPRVAFGISVDGGQTWDRGLLAMPAVLAQTKYTSVDPHIWHDAATGEMWLVAQADSPEVGPTYLIAVKRGPGGAAATLPRSQVVAPPVGQQHRPVMGSGPSPGGGRSTYLLWSRVGDPHPLSPTFGCGSTHMMIARSDDGGAWSAPIYVKPPVHPPQTRCEFAGNALGVHVVDRGPHRGMVIAFFGGYDAVWSLDGGQTWAQQAVQFLDRALLPEESDIAGPFRTPFFADVAFDPATGDFVIAACGKEAPGSKNLDLYLVRGRATENDAAVPVVFDPPVRLQLDVPQRVDGPDQFFPSVAVDGLGGINVLYYDTREHVVPDDSPSAFLNAYAARVTGLATRGQVIQTFRLSSTFCTDCTECGFPSNCLYEDPLLPQFIGDYNTIDAAGGEVYATYLSIESGQRHYYARRLSVVTPDDDAPPPPYRVNLATFPAHFAAGDARADLNGDGVVDGSDLAALAGTPGR